jgi:CRISPR-associated protein Csx16
MTTYFVTRHPGALDWAAGQGIAVDQRLEHLEIALIRPGDTVIGTLPVHLVAAICERGARYRHLALEIPPEARGRELSAAELEAFGARLETYHVRHCDD